MALIEVLDKFRETLAACYWWQRLADPLNPWDLPTAAEHIYKDGLPPPNPGPDHTLAELVALRPFCLVWHDMAGGFRLARDNTGGCVKASGTLIAQLEIAVPDQYSANPDGLADYLNLEIGRILWTRNAAQPGLLELGLVPGYLVINDAVVFGYARTDPKDVSDIGDCAVAELQISWGIS